MVSSLGDSAGNTALRIGTGMMLPYLMAALVGCLAVALASGASGAVVQRQPLHRETELDRAVILVPDTPEYQALGRQLAAAISQRTGFALAVQSADGYVSASPRAVKAEALAKHFIVLGQFWDNAVLERLYAGMFDPTDAVFPGPGGWQLRTVCSPFRSGQNCVVVSGSDLAGCRKAVAELPARLQSRDGTWQIPFLHQVQLTGEAATAETAYRQRAATVLAHLGEYETFGAPNGKTWTGEDPRDFLTWHDRNLAAAAVFGVRYWATANPQDGEAFRRLLLGCQAEVARLEQGYREGRTDLIEYSLDGLTIAWDLVLAPV
jgi:hypothetical protein